MATSIALDVNGMIMQAAVFLATSKDPSEADLKQALAGNLTFPEIPTVDIELVDHPTDKPWGAGEPAAAVVPAIANAVFDAIGVRLRSVPFTPAKVLAAIRAGS